MFDFLYTLIHGEGYRERYLRQWREADEKRDKEFEESKRNIDKTITAQKAYEELVIAREAEDLKDNKLIESINEANDGIIQARKKNIEDAKSFIAHVNKNLNEISCTRYLKSYEKEGFYYILAYCGGTYEDPRQRVCLRGCISDNNEIKELRDLWKDIDQFRIRAEGLRPFDEIHINTLLDFYEFLPDFYEECLKNCKD